MFLALLIPLTAYTLPPENYRADNTVTVTFAKPELVQELCGRRGVKELIGCTIGKTMIVPNPCAYPEQSYARTLCHEGGHSQGWGADHKGEQP